MPAARMASVIRMILSWVGLDLQEQWRGGRGRRRR